MRLISIREFQLNASKYLDNLPIGLTRYGKVVATVVEGSIDTEEAVATVIEEVKQDLRCKHGYPPRLCKYGCLWSEE